MLLAQHLVLLGVVLRAVLRLLHATAILRKQGLGLGLPDGAGRRDLLLDRGIFARTRKTTLDLDFVRKPWS